jgi:hypothetical protein
MASGTWTLKIKSEGAPDETATLILLQNGTSVSGSLQGDSAAVQISAGSIDAAGNLKFTTQVTFADKTAEATFNGKLSGNQLSGTVQATGRPASTFIGTRPQGE